MVLKDFLTKNLLVKHNEESHPLMRLQRDMNRIFDRFFDDFRPSVFDAGALSSFPKVDIKETKKEIQVTAELPGMEANDIDISISDDVLTLRGEKSQESKSEGEDYYHMERAYGLFHRSVALPNEVESDNVKAEFKNGVLKLLMPKKPAAQRKAKKIEIKAT